jgi:hypothetical protein
VTKHIRKILTFLAFLPLCSFSILLGKIIFIFGQILTLIINPGECHNYHPSCIDHNNRQLILSIIAVIYAFFLILYLLIVNHIIIKIIARCHNFIADNCHRWGLSRQMINQSLRGFILLNIGVGIFLNQLLDILKSLLK